MSEHRAPRERLDKVLVARGLAPTRAQGQALIMAGRVFSGDTRLDKPGTRVDPTVPLEVRGGRRWASRGGTKLFAALDQLGVDPAGRDCLDVGASTGGFTHVLLERDAARVSAVDVGRGQLDWGLRQDPRVHVIDGVNARYLAPDRLPFLPSLVVVDVSFISLRLILPSVVRCLDEPGEVVSLVKPQFEVGRGRVGRGGIVRDPALHREVLGTLADECRRQGWGVRNLVASTIAGAEGNREFFLHLCPRGGGLEDTELRRRIDEVSATASESPR